MQNRPQNDIAKPICPHPSVAAAGPKVAAYQKQLGDKPGNDHLQQRNSIA